MRLGSAAESRARRSTEAPSVAAVGEVDDGEVVQRHVLEELVGAQSEAQVLGRRGEGHGAPRSRRSRLSRIRFGAPSRAARIMARPNSSVVMTAPGAMARMRGSKGRRTV